MTFGRLLLAWLAVTIWMVGSALPRWRLTSVTPEPGDFGVTLPRRHLVWLLVETVTITLFASLWFDSLGSGGWWLLFLLVGLLPVARAQQQTLPVPSASRRRIVVALAADVGRYVIAGGILALILQ